MTFNQKFQKLTRTFFPIHNIHISYQILIFFLNTNRMYFRRVKYRINKHLNIFQELLEEDVPKKPHSFLIKMFYR